MYLPGAVSFAVPGPASLASPWRHVAPPARSFNPRAADSRPMDGEAFVSELEAAKATELDRLGSSKLLVALTEANLDEERVLQVAAASEHAAAETFHGWAADEPDDGAREAFSDVAAQEDDHEARVVAHLDGFEPPTAPGPMHAYLRGREDTVERIATGMVARPLVSRRTHNQVIGFFVNEADREMADLFRELKADTQAVIETGTTLLAARCDDEDDWERARATAEYLIQVAYDDYADGLAEMGLDPKPIC